MYNKSKRNKLITFATTLAIAVTAVFSVCGMHRYTAHATGYNEEFNNFYYFANHTEHSYLSTNKYCSGNWYMDTEDMIYELFDPDYEADGNPYSDCVLVFDIKFQDMKDTNNCFDRTKMYNTYADLTELFKSIQNQLNSYVILINDLDETRLPKKYPAAYGFLQYVDYHINTDIFTLFLDNTFRVMRENGLGAYETTIILNEYMAEYWFYHDYLNYFFKGHYSIVDMGNESNLIDEIEEYLEFDCITFVIPDDSNSVYSATEKQSDYLQYMYKWTKWTYPIYHSESDITVWSENVEAIFDNANYESNEIIFSYNEAEIDIGFEDRTIYSAGWGLLDYIDYFLPYAVEYIIEGGDVTFITNYHGICYNSYKTLPPSVTGWMQWFTFEDFWAIDFIPEYD